MPNPGDALAVAVRAYLDNFCTDSWGLATAYALYMKQCGEEVDVSSIVKGDPNA